MDILLFHWLVDLLIQLRRFPVQELYHESYSSIAVMFASIPNYKEFYDETDINKQGLECLRLLNEIICDFDKLLLKPKYSSIEKIKTIGSTYMLACGLSPGKEDGDGLVRKLIVFINNGFVLMLFNDFRFRSISQNSKSTTSLFSLSLLFHLWLCWIKSIENLFKDLS